MAQTKFGDGYDHAKSTVRHTGPHNLEDQLDFAKGVVRGLEEELTIYRYSKQVTPLTDEEKEALNQPLPLKNRLKIGTWYRYEGALESHIDKSIVVFYKGGGVQTYGQWSHNGWLVKATVGWDFGKWVEATEDEVEEVLVAEANRRYTGKSFKYLRHIIPFKSLGFKEYTPTCNALRANYNGLLVELFRDGEWAEVVDEVKCELINLDKCSKENLEQMSDQLQMELKNRK